MKTMFNETLPGAVVASRELKTIHADQVQIPDPRQLIHLQFRRFAGCPVCDLHLHSMVQRHSELTTASIREVVVFHSSTGDLLRHAGDLPFAVIADPDRRLYSEFGVESAPRALLDPRVWAAIVRGVFRSLGAFVRGRPLPPFNPRGGRFGLPADFLIASDGRVLASKHGSHAYDQWTVDEILALSAGGTASRGSTGADAERATVGAMIMFALTTVHHLYGAYIYHTPWRLHASLIDGLATALIVASMRAMRRRSGDRAGRIASWAFILTTFLIPFLGFGVFEGAYNHILKLALYLAHARPSLMTRFFPPPAYEMPNNVLFEITGVMQVIPGFMTGYYLYRFMRGRTMGKRAGGLTE